MMLRICYARRVTRTLQQIGLSVKRLQMRHHRAANAELATLDISLVQWDALRHLDENPGASLHDLAQLTFQTDQSFGALADRLMKRGMIERVAGPGRAIRHRLTPAGKKTLREGREIANAVLKASFAPLSNRQRDQLFGLIFTTLSDGRPAQRVGL